MAGELGFVALIAAWFFCIFQLITGLVGVFTRSSFWQRQSIASALTFSFAISFSFLMLVLAFEQSDFSLAYVAEHSNSLMPWYYRISAVWGGHEGSMLLWLTVLGGWCVALVLKSNQLPMLLRSRIFVVMALIELGMCSFVLFTSSPFIRTLPSLVVDGAELNPLLQDPGLIFHPPTLYMGYVGMVVPFAFCMAALWSGRLDSAWTRWCRPWAIAAWIFLTLGIVLGSYWAYYELGWGGWWFWDPVENASFMPWLASTALLHSLSVTENRGVFKAWTILLAILAFALSLLGTFLVRSGVLTSVHAFASDPQRGYFILAILAITIGVSLTLYAVRGYLLTAEAQYTVRSKESLLVVNNILLLIATLIVLLGTLYPLIADAFNLGQVSVGAPYFNTLFVPLTWLSMLVMAIAPLVRWKNHKAAMLKQIVVYGGISLLVGIVVSYLVVGGFSLHSCITIALACWVVLWMAADVRHNARFKSSWFKVLKQQKLSYWGMQFAHIGVLLTAIGIVLTTTLSVEKDVPLAPSQSHQVGDYTFKFDGIKHGQNDNYDFARANIQVYKNNQLVTELQPEKRTYTVQKKPMTEAGIRSTLLKDLYVALGEPLNKKDPQSAWSIRLYIKPYVVWIWIGALFMAFGGLLALCDKRYKLLKVDKK